MTNPLKVNTNLGTFSLKPPMTRRQAHPRPSPHTYRMVSPRGHYHRVFLHVLPHNMQALCAPADSRPLPERVEEKPVVFPNNLTGESLDGPARGLHVW